MKKLFYRISIISLAVVLASCVLHLAVYPKLKIAPWTRGSDLLEMKRQELLREPGNYNSLVIGSSRVYRQIDPEILDSVLYPVEKLSTYNLGVNWLFAPESFYVLDQLNQTDHLKFKFVIIELSKIRSIDYANLHTARIKYWYTFSNYCFAVKAIITSTFSWKEKTATILAHTISYLDQLLNLGYLTETFYFRAEIQNPSKKIESGRNGFLPLAISEKNTGEENTAERHRLFLSDTTIVTRKWEISKNQFEKFEARPELLHNYNRVYAEKLNGMVREYAASGTRLIFLLSPRIDKNQYDELIPLFNQIDPEHRIEISDGRKYPFLYQAQYSFDASHLNEEGAAIYTRILGHKLKEMVQHGGN